MMCIRWKSSQDSFFKKKFFLYLAGALSSGCGHVLSFHQFEKNISNTYVSIEAFAK